MRGHVPAAMRRENARIEESRMRGSKLAVALLLLLAAAVGVSLTFVRAGGSGAEVAHAGAITQQMATAVDRAATVVVEAIKLGRERAPAVVVGLGALIVVPLIALAMLFARRLGNVWAADQASTHRARRAADAAALPRLANAWIDVDGPGRRRLRIAGELVRIGRDEENDLRLEDPNVHRHHALIQRTADAEFVILDVSGMRGNGLAVNGRRLARASLRDGDLIELGTTRVRFRCEPISHAMTA
jgi:hypothetical protein